MHGIKLHTNRTINIDTKKELMALCHVVQININILCREIIFRYLCSNSHVDEHKEEENGPERRHGQSGHGLRVHNKCQTGTYKKTCSKC